MDPFDQLLELWSLDADGEAIVTFSSRLLPVRRDGELLMLKLAVHHEEELGNGLMDWWQGDGAARVVAHEGNAILMERATGPQSLTEMAIGGKDDEAARVLCHVALRLHKKNGRDLPNLVPLTRWFAELAPAATAHGGLFAEASAIAVALLKNPIDMTVLHGDLHHGNVLDFGDRGWLAIDPKGLQGERGFDFANIFCNPTQELAADADRFSQRVDVVCEEAHVARGRLLQWIAAWTGLSASWSVADACDPENCLTVTQLAITALKS